MLNLPNILSFFRILLVPLLVVVLLTKFHGKEMVGLAVFLVAAFTDFLDGFLARRRQQITRLGKLLDPAADKILISAAFISLVEISPELVPAWIVVVLVAREFAISSLRAFAASEGLVIAAGISGKVKTVLQVLTISLLIVHAQAGAVGQLAPLLLWATLVVSVYSGGEYFVRFAHLVRDGGPRSAGGGGPEGGGRAGDGAGEGDPHPWEPAP